MADSVTNLVTNAVTDAAGEDTEQHHGNSLASRRDWQDLESGRSMEEQELAAAAAPPAPAAIRAWGAPRQHLKKALAGGRLVPRVGLLRHRLLSRSLSPRPNILLALHQLLAVELHRRSAGVRCPAKVCLHPMPMAS